ncbi:tape measure protein [Microbacterium phage BAjuniper]|nr:tape measure protein [Microbacterium phage BAjuniper]
MANGVELAQAWVRLVPTLEGSQGIIAKELGGESEKAGKDSGKRFGGAMAGAVAGIVAPLAASALQGIKDLVGEMAAQVDSTKKFRSTLEFAGVSDKNIKQLTKATQEYADKTIYGLSDIRNITSQLASNGVKDYDKLAQAAGNLNAVAGGNAETFKSVGMVLTQTAGQGKLTAENWNQLADAIPGASGKIQEALAKNGAFTGNFREAMSEGQITSEEFNAALMELGTDPVAVAAASSTETFEGSIGNLQASIVKVGASIMEKLAPAFSVVTGVLSDVIAGVTPVVDFLFSSPPLIAGLGAALLVALAPALWGVVTATWAWTAALLANPMTWIVLLIGGLVAAIVYLATQTTFFQDLWEGAMKVIGDAADWLWTNVLNPVFTFIGDVFTWLWQYIIKPIVDLVVNYFRFWAAVVMFLWEHAVQPVFKWIGDIFNWIWTNVIKPVVDWITDKLNLLGLGFRILYEQYVKPAFEAVGDVLETVWHWIDTNVFTPFKVGIDLIGQAFENVAKAIGVAWDGIKKAAAVPINFVLDTVWNNGLRSFWNDMVGTLGLNDMKLPKADLVKFASGGVMPGYTPGRDVHQFWSPTAGGLALSGGEAIMRPEFTRLVGGAAGVARLNAMARRGTLAFKDGGVWGDVMGFAGDVWDNVANAASVAWEFLSDPAGAIQRHVVDGLIGPLMGGAGEGVFGKTVGGLVTKMVKGAAKLFQAPGGAGKGTKGMGWQAMWDVVKGAVPGAVMTSNFRPGSRTVNGGQSYHALGRAIDVVPASMATFNALARLFPNASELIYTPAGSRQLLNGRPFAGWSDAVKRQHYNHVHLALAQGGVIPGLMNGGTVTKSGYTVVGERGPELLKLPEGAQVNPDYDEVPDGRKVIFQNYAPLGSTPSQELETFANRAEVFLP